MSRSTRTVETSDYIGFMRRIIKAASKRVGDGNAEELLELLALRAELDVAIKRAAVGLNETGVTWREIGELVGSSRQAAWERWGKP